MAQFSRRSWSGAVPAQRHGATPGPPRRETHPGPRAHQAYGGPTHESQTLALLGAGTGAALGSLSGDAGKGALIGAGAGALGGYLYDQNRKAEARRYYRNDRHGYSRNDRRYGYYHRNRYGSNEYLW
jgi:hypothetical protein